MKHLWVSLLCLLSAGAVAADKAGEVVFTVGEAAVHHGSVLKPLKRGDVLEAGDTLVTGGNGYVHLRMVDQGFVSLRPASRLLIEQYRYDPANPRNNAIKYKLEEGVMRSVTGKGGEAAKDRFRLNTPVAAIGIRGTDFTVFTSAQETRVSIRRGGVAVSPFNAQCQAAALGPCTGSSVLDLLAGKVDQVLQVHKQDAVPQLKHDQNKKLAPDSVAPPLPEENTQPVTTGAIKHNDPSAASMAAVLPGDETLTDVATSKPLPKVSALQPANTGPVTPVTPPAPIIYAKLDWGRWGDSKTNALLAFDHDVIDTGYPEYVLSRSKDVVSLPDKGSFNFKLTDSVAAVIDPNSGAHSPATVNNGALTVDFANHAYTTDLTVSAPALNSPVQLHSSNNNLARDGTFNGELTASNNMKVTGALSGDGNQAGYGFDTGDALKNTRIKGMTMWTH